MTTNDDMTPRQPDEGEPREELRGDELDLVDETVARITDAEVNEHLRKVLHQPRYGGPPAISCGQFVGPRQKNSAERGPDLVGLSGSPEAVIAAARLAAADIIADAQLKAKTASDELQRTQEAVAGARQQAEQMVADARTETDEALERVVKMIRDAKEQAARIIGDARKEAEQIITAARSQQVQQTALARHRTAAKVSYQPPAERLAAGGVLTDSPTHSQEDHTRIGPPGGNPVPERCSPSSGPARGDSAYGRIGLRSDLPALATSPEPCPTVSVVIPTLNEARNLPHIFAKLPAGLHEVILVDGNSVDDTVATARRLRPDVRIVMQNRRGKGNALACGFAAATGDVIAIVDADGSADPAEIPQFVRALLDGADFAKGTRFTAGGGSSDITRLRRLGNRMLSGLVNVLCRTKYSDLCYGYNAFWRRHVPVFGLDVESDVPHGSGARLWGDGFEIETLINVRIAQAGLKVTEVASFEHSRIHGVSNLNAARDGWRVLRTILAERYYHHNRRKAQRKLAAGDGYAAGRLADLLAERGDLDGLRARADAGDGYAAGRLADLLAGRGDLDGLRARADAGDGEAAGRLAALLYERGDLDELRARADADDGYAAVWLAALLAGRGDLDGLRARADAGDGEAAGRLAALLYERGDRDGAVQILRARADAGDESTAGRLVDLLIKQGRGEEAQRLRHRKAMLAA